MNDIIREIKLKRVEGEMYKLEDLQVKNLLEGKEFKDENKLIKVTSEYYSLLNYTGYKGTSEGVLKTKRKKRS